MDSTQFLQLHQSIKVHSITGRYLPANVLGEFLKGLPSSMRLKVEGKSVEKRSIYSLTVGNGGHRLLLWSQMHGNESTTTKALIDFLQFLKRNPNHAFCKQVLENVTLKIIPILNPDGAERYTRINANAVDLNRDVKNRTQPESHVLQQVFADFKPDYCFNLHDQRTIFGAGKRCRPATLSFLSPAFDQDRTINATRAMAMRLIVGMNSELQKIIPGQIGRYDDAFNPNCVGDHFQALDTPTILFEAGHFQGDYLREKTRGLIFVALCTAIQASLEENPDFSIEKVNREYLDIPENEKNYFDILIRNVQYNGENTSIAIQYKEQLIAKKINFVPVIAHIGNLDKIHGHQEIDGKNKKLRINNGNNAKKGLEIQEISLDNEIFSTDLTNY